MTKEEVAAIIRKRIPDVERITASAPHPEAEPNGAWSFSVPTYEKNIHLAELLLLRDELGACGVCVSYCGREYLDLYIEIQEIDGTYEDG